MALSKKRSILRTFLQTLLPVVIGAVVVTGSVMTFTNHMYFKKTVSRDYRNILASASGEIRMYVEGAQHSLESLASVLSATKLDEWQKQMALSAFNHINPQFNAISLISAANGSPLTTGWRQTDGGTRVDGLIKTVKSVKTWRAEIRTDANSIPHLHIAVPLLRLGEVASILYGELDLKAVWRVLEGIRVGTSGQVAILDADGRFVGHRDMTRVVNAVPGEPHGLLKKIRSAPGPVEWIEQGAGVQQFCMGVHLSDLDWIVVLSQPKTEIFRYLYQNMTWSAWIVLGAALVAVLAGWGGTRRLLRPIRRLHRQVVIVGRCGPGSMATTLAPVQTRDEIGELSQAFYHMTQSLTAYIRREVDAARELAHARNLALLGTASGKVAHEVGNFLNNIGIAMATLSREPLGSKGIRAIDIVTRESVSIRSFAERFLQSARKPELRAAPMPVARLVDQIPERFRQEAEPRGISIRVDLKADLPSVEADADLLGHALDNLIRNSIEAIGGPGEIRITAEAEKNAVLLIIEDTGPGLSADQRNHIFDPFFSTKPSGSGLGLSIVKTVIEAHRGSVICPERGEGAGAAFHIRLPVAGIIPAADSLFGTG